MNDKNFRAQLDFTRPMLDAAGAPTNTPTNTPTPAATAQPNNTPAPAATAQPNAAAPAAAAQPDNGTMPAAVAQPDDTAASAAGADAAAAGRVRYDEAMPERPERSYAGLDHTIAALQRQKERYAEESDEARKKREKRDKARRVIASVGDGLAALANLYFTTQYAPNMYDPKTNMRDKVDAQQKAAAAERERRADKGFDVDMKLGTAMEGKDKAAMDDADAKMRRWLTGREDARAQDKSDADAALRPYKQQAAETAAEQGEANLGLTKEKANTEKEKQDYYRRRGSGGGGGGGREQVKHHYRGVGYASDRDHTAAVNRDLPEYNSAAEKYNDEARKHNAENPNDQWKLHPTFKASEQTLSGTNYTPVEQYAGVLEQYFENKAKGLDIAGRRLKRQQQQQQQQQIGGLFD